ncbi:BCCT family transporter [Bacillus sp. V2I10]|uniref:glycine betaine uptake BCCT transporter n=1 Tax=Bacillus sp. V2I10 TaxID=3042276 RepID=UPI0027855040|nr:BCCT family transporter [Bacillus sp. V2I10]MDQ0862157.1 glycine betaine transporter [Bacillus sp. V2I10]
MKKNSVFISALLISGLFILFGIFFNELIANLTGAFLKITTEYFGWFYLLATLVFLIYIVYLMFSKFGNLRLGKETDRPEYSTVSWFSMLFSAGMGIGLVFWGVAEPIMHYTSPPYGEGNTDESANTAMMYTFFHWGLHPWAIYTFIGLSLAFFQYRKNLPGLISSIFSPILGDRIYGPIGKTIDVLAIVATIFGIATSLGLGALQITSGINFLFDIPNNFTNQIIIIILLTLLFTGSAFVGIDRGMKVISNTNILLAISLMIILIILGPTAQIFKVFTNTLGIYLDQFLYTSLRIPPIGDNSWVSSWTLFYWAWWIAWGPFVGSFIAKVSKGRTIKEFILGVLIIPTLGTFFWFSTFGASSLHLVHDLGNKVLVSAVNNDVSVALFVFLENFPGGFVLSLVFLLLIVTFFITSADSATLVLAIFCSEGRLNPSRGIKITWGIALALISVVLLLSGSLETLQSASIAAAFPFTILMIIMCYTLYKALREENAQIIIHSNKTADQKEEKKEVV